MTFASDMNRFTLKLDKTTRAVYVAAASAVQESVKFGRPETGAPGQPVDTSFLLNSWTLDIGPEVATLSTNVAYARVIEDNNRAAYDARGKTNDRKNPDGTTRRSIKSKVGGNHSVKLTRAGWDRLLRSVVREVVG